jgi:hypothetical protein
MERTLVIMAKINNTPINRLEAWQYAAELVNPIVEQHGLERYSPGANIFSTGISVMTPVEQHINHILNVAEWLLNEKEDDAR